MSNPKRYSLAGLIGLLYFIPILILSTYSLFVMPTKDSWNLFTTGLTIACGGTILLYILLWQISKEKHNTISTPNFSPVEREQCGPSPELLALQDSIATWAKKYDALDFEFRQHQEEALRTRQEKDYYHRQMDLAMRELESCRNTTQEQLQEKERVLQECLQTAREQRSLIEKHQQFISSLESKEKELHDELKTLSHLTHFPYEENKEMKRQTKNSTDALDRSVAKHSPEGAKLQLKIYLDTATKMTGAQYFGPDATRFGNLSVDNHVLDMRRLFDNLQDENYLVLVYSQKESKVLFVNNPVRRLLGWSPERFSQGFQEMIQPAQEEWRKGINLLTISQEAQFPISIKSKTGQAMPFHCQLGMVHSGLFRQHIIGVLYPEPISASG